MNLRKYQKQALHWMIGKEKDEKAENKEVSMHPLWEEYRWPTKDVDNKALPEVAEQSSFYVNPYSGELSLDFPVQEQNCLGGILADGKELITPLTTSANSCRNGPWKDDRDAQSHT
jgi:DNA repair protein RAD5